MNIKLFRNGKEIEHKIQEDEKGILLIQDTIVPEDDIKVEITITETEKFPAEIFVGGTKSAHPIKLKKRKDIALYK